MSRRALLLTPAAQIDIDDIWTFSAQVWGVDRAERYVRAIGAACEGLARGTTTAQATDILPGYWKTAVGSHMIYGYERTDGTLVVVRVLHQQMDATRHLSR